VVVVSDSSTDRTAEVAEAAGARPEAAVQPRYRRLSRPSAAWEEGYELADAVDGDGARRDPARDRGRPGRRASRHSVGSRFISTGGYRSSAAPCRIRARVVVSTIARQKAIRPDLGQALNRRAIGLYTPPTCHFTSPEVEGS
jgi:glycosyltransferase involved in cell wall biosynthesis